MLPSTGFWMALFWGFVVLLVLVGFAQVRARLRERLDTGLDDDDIRGIEERGSFHDPLGEPLDLDHIEEEEDRFWNEERWDEADEW